MNISTNDEAVCMAERFLHEKGQPFAKLIKVSRGVQHSEFYQVCFEYPDSPDNISPGFLLVTVPVSGDEPFFGVVT